MGLNLELPFSRSCTRYIFRSAYVTGGWGTIDHRRGADTTAAKHAGRIYQTGSSLLPLESDAIKNKKGPISKGHVLVIRHTTATKKKEKKGHFISTKYRVLHSRVQPGQVCYRIYVTRPRVWTGKDCFAIRLRDVPMLYQYIHLSPVDPYDYATSVIVTTSRQTCLFSSARE